MGISFVLNNRPVTANIAPDTRVIDLLREILHMTGTKEGCGSGECGACTVLVEGEIRLSCLMLAEQIHGKSVTTIEGLGGQGKLHPLQQTFIDYGAVQCGFCTPGMVLAAVDLLGHNPRPTREEIREGISGNLCRCTGYQKIVDAVEAAAPMTERYLPDFTATRTQVAGPVKPHLQLLLSKKRESTGVFLPSTLNELWGCLADEPGARIFAGGTDLLVKIRSETDAEILLVGIEKIHELSQIREESDMVFIGSCCVFSQLLRSQLIGVHFPVLVQALSVLGSPPVRNMATIGGNICTASPAGDTLPPLYILDAVLELRSMDSSRFVPLRQFILGPGQTTIQQREILYGVWIKKPDGFTVHHFEKVGLRKALAISVASLAGLIRISPDGIIEDVRLAWGSVGPVVIRSEAVEKSLTGTHLSIEGLRAVVPLIEQAVLPINDVRASARYRRKIAGNLIVRLSQYGFPMRDKRYG